jgi:hypothetical protein
MSPKRIFRMAYHTSLSKNSRFRIHQLRDGDAFSELSAVLYSRGYEYGGLLLNLPSEKPLEPHPVDISSLTSSDLVLLNTRPPIDDIEEEDKHLVRQSFTNFEAVIFNAVKPKYFEWCARSHIILSETLARQLPTGFRDRANMLFHQSRDGSYIKHGEYASGSWRPPADQRLTAVFFIQIPALWEGGPGLLAAFGMAGIETLAWNYLLRTRFLRRGRQAAEESDWLDSYSFLMAEVLPKKVPRKPTNLSFAEEWEVVPILRIPLTQDLA